MLIDSHCHFDFEPFASDPDGYLELARQAGVGKIIIPSVGERNWLVVGFGAFFLLLEALMIVEAIKTLRRPPAPR